MQAQAALELLPVASFRPSVLLDFLLVYVLLEWPAERYFAVWLCHCVEWPLVNCRRQVRCPLLSLFLFQLSLLPDNSSYLQHLHKKSDLAFQRKQDSACKGHV